MGLCPRCPGAGLSAGKGPAVVGNLDKIISLARTTEFFQSRLDGATAKTRELAVKGIFAKELLGALLLCGTGLVAWGVFSGLSRLLDPAIAAVLTGSTILGLLVAVAWQAARTPGQD